MNGAAQRPRGLTALLLGVGALGLAASMLIGTLTVIARHLGIALVGDIELMQTAILVTSAASLVAATLERRHASVHLLIDRLPAPARAALARVNTLLAACFFALLAVGLGWITLELTHAHEQSELLHIPYAPLRWISLTATVLAGLLSLAAALRAEP